MSLDRLRNTPLIPDTDTAVTTELDPVTVRQLKRTPLIPEAPQPVDVPDADPVLLKRLKSTPLVPNVAGGGLPASINTADPYLRPASGTDLDDYGQPVEYDFAGNPILQAPPEEGLHKTPKQLQQRTFMGNLMEAYGRGDRNVDLDIALYEAGFEGRGDVNKVLDLRKKRQKNEAEDPIEGNWLSEMVYGSANIIPGMLKGYKEAIPYAATGATAGMLGAAAAGQAGPQVLLPEEVVTVPAAGLTGATIGLQVGSANFWYKQGAGAMLGEMLDKGYDPKVAKTISSIAGIPYALIELSQVGKLTPGIRQGAQQVVKKSMLKVLGKAAKQYGKTLTEEVLEEIAQEGVSIAAEDLAGYFSKQGVEYNKDALKERATRLWETGKGAAKSMALLPIPGAMQDVATGINKQQKIDNDVTPPENTPLGIIQPGERSDPATFTAKQKQAIVNQARNRLSLLENNTTEPLMRNEQEFLRTNLNNPDAIIQFYDLRQPETEEVSTPSKNQTTQDVDIPPKNQTATFAEGLTREQAAGDEADIARAMEQIAQEHYRKTKKAISEGKPAPDPLTPAQLRKQAAQAVAQRQQQRQGQVDALEAKQVDKRRVEARMAELAEQEAQQQAETIAERMNNIAAREQAGEEFTEEELQQILTLPTENEGQAQRRRYEQAMEELTRPEKRPQETAAKAKPVATHQPPSDVTQTPLNVIDETQTPLRTTPPDRVLEETQPQEPVSITTASTAAKAKPVVAPKPLAETTDKQSQITKNTYNPAGDVVDGREVLKEIPNQDSISASLEDYEIVKGIQEVPMSVFELTGKSYSVSENKRIAELAEEIRESGKISPLIVVEDKEGLYILEGGHRADALYRLKAQSFPAMVVKDIASLNELEQPLQPTEAGTGTAQPTGKAAPEAEGAPEEMQGTARKLNLKYEGVQEDADGNPSYHTFTDPQTGSTFMVKPGDDLAAKLQQMREKFNTTKRETYNTDKKYARAKLPTDWIQADPQRFQFKQDATGEGGVTDALQGIKKYDPIKGGTIVAWKDKEGNHFVVDGHHRLSLAKKLGQPTMDAWVLSEEDGISAVQARVIGAMRNLSDGKGTAIDAAKVFRESNLDVEDLQKEGVPTNNAIVRQGLAMRDLSDDVFRMVIDQKLSANLAAILGQNVKDHTKQKEVADLIINSELVNAREVELLVRTIDAAPVLTESTKTLFGEDVNERSLYVERAKILANLEKKLKTDKKIFGVLSQKAGKIESEGNVLAKDRNEQIRQQADELLYLLERLADKKGPIGDAINQATIEYAQTPTKGKLVEVTETLLRRLQTTESQQVQDIQGVHNLFDQGTQGPVKTKPEDQGEVTEAVPPSTAPEAEEKQPWEMGQDEFVEWSSSETGLNPNSPAGHGLGTHWDVWKRGHKTLVKHAHAEGETIPPEVQAEYPELFETKEAVSSKRDAEKTAAKAPEPASAALLAEAGELGLQYKGVIRSGDRSAYRFFDPQIGKTFGVEPGKNLTEATQEIRKLSQSAKQSVTEQETYRQGVAAYVRGTGQIPQPPADLSEPARHIIIREEQDKAEEDGKLRRVLTGPPPSQRQGAIAKRHKQEQAKPVVVTNATQARSLLEQGRRIKFNKTTYWADKSGRGDEYVVKSQDDDSKFVSTLGQPISPYSQEGAIDEIVRKIELYTKADKSEPTLPASFNLDEISEDDLADLIAGNMGEQANVTPATTSETPPQSTPQQSKPPVISDETKQAWDEAKDALKDIRDYLGGQASSNPVLDPKLLQLTAKATAKLLKAGVYTFSDVVKHFKNSLGIDLTRQVGPTLEVAWERVRILDKSGKMGPVGNVAEILGSQESSTTPESTPEPELKLEDYEGFGTNKILLTGWTKENQAQIRHINRRIDSGYWYRPAMGWVYPKDKEAELRRYLGGLLRETQKQKLPKLADNDIIETKDQIPTEVQSDEQTEESNPKRPGRVRTNGDETLGTVPAQTDQATETGGDVLRDDQGTGGRGGGHDAKSKEEGGRSSNSDGTGETRVHPASRRGGDADRGLNYRISDVDQIGGSGQKTKARQNIRAIRILKQIELDNRRATADEQAELVKYVGWGGIPQIFDDYKDDWKSEYQQLRDLLTDEEYDAARRSTLNAHYTSIPVIRGMWNALKKLGFEGGKINEPAAGIGHFFGAIPEDIAHNSQLYGSELDSITGRIAQQLYQNSDIRVSGFEKLHFPDNYFDLFISNVPFGDFKIHDPELKKLSLSIHDYFFVKALKKTRPGGLVAFITSRYTLDKKNSYVRSLIAKEADLVGAIRLPNNAFKSNANTEVVTDIIILQKRDAKQFSSQQKFAGLGEITKNGENFSVNEYFVTHPNHILGNLSYSGSMYSGKELTVKPKKIDLSAAIEEIGETLETPHPVVTVDTKIDSQDIADTIPASSEIKNLGLVEQNGKIYQKNGEQLVDMKLSPAVIRRVKQLIKVRNAARDLLHAQINPEEKDVKIETYRKILNSVYDSFVKNYGYLHNSYTQRTFSDDPDLALLLSLENYDEETKKATKAAIFTERTQHPYSPVVHVDTASDALIASLNEKGKINFDYMQSIYGQDQNGIIEELGNNVYYDPILEEWQTNTEYLSGNVREKLKSAEIAAKTDPIYQRNVDALKAVQPKDISPINIDVRLGATWVPAEQYAQFTNELLQRNDVKIHYGEGDAIWSVEGDNRDNAIETNDWGTKRMDALSLIEKAMNLKQPTIFDPPRVSGDKHSLNRIETMAARGKLNDIKRAFSEWIWKDIDRRIELGQIYNEKFNHTVFAKWDGSHLQLPNSSSLITLKAHQKNAIWRWIVNGNMLMGHTVGSGKTMTMAGIAMEARRLGLARKPVITVPNHLLSNTQEEIYKLYPGAQLLVASPNDFKPRNRQTLMHRIATGNWDIVIVPHTSFEKVPMSPGIVQKFFDEELGALEAEIQELKAARGDTRSIVKDLERAKVRLENQLSKNQASWKKDKGPYFDELGIDLLFVDEAQEFKNLWFRTKMTRVAGIAQKQVQRSFDMFLKTRYLNRVTGGRGVVFSTGTPITNSVTEMFTLQRYLQLGKMEEIGISHFDAWAQNFGDTITGVEVTPEGGGFRVHTRFAKFTNIPELMQLFRSVADIQTAKMLKLPVPKLKNGTYTIVQAPETEELKDIVAGLVERAEAIRSGQVDQSEDNMLAVTHYGRIAALDLRMIDSKYPDYPDSKVNRVVNTTYDIWKSHPNKQSLQVIWCDLSVPKAGKWSIYSDIKSKLVKKGIPESEVVFVHDADGNNRDKNLKTMFKKARTGKIRIILASTSKMGTGANIQKNMVAAHHLEPPWRPADIEQRDGRILRQGNDNKEVEIFRYGTKGSFDAYMWQTLETKSNFIEQIMSGNTSVRSMEELNKQALSYAEMKAITAGNPKIMEAVKLQSDVAQLDAEYISFQDQKYSNDRKLRELPENIERIKKNIQEYKSDKIAYDKTKEESKNEIELIIGKKTYTTKKAAGKILLSVIKQLPNDTRKEIGSFYGFTLIGRRREYTNFNQEKADAYDINLIGPSKTIYYTDLSDSESGNITRLFNLGKDGIQQSILVAKATLKREQKQQADLESRKDNEYSKLEELQEKTQRLNQLQAELQIGNGQDDVVVNEEQINNEEESPKPDGPEFDRESGKAAIPAVDDVKELFSLPGKLKDLAASIPGLEQSVHALARLTDTGGGTNWGEVLANSFYRITDRHMELEGLWKSFLYEAMGHLSKAQQAEYIKVHDGQINIKDASDAVRKAVQATNRLGDIIGMLAEHVQLPMIGEAGEEGTFRKLNNFYPIMWNQETIDAVQKESGQKWKELIEWVGEDLERRGLEFNIDEGIREKTKNWSKDSYQKQAARFLRVRRQYDPAQVRLQNMLTALKDGSVSMSEIGAKVNRGMQLHRAFDYPAQFREENPYRVWERHIERASRRVAEAEIWDKRTTEIDKATGQEKPKRITNGLLKQWTWAGTSQAEKRAKQKGHRPDDAKRKFLELLTHLLGYESRIEGLQSNTSREAKAALRTARTVTSGVHLFGLKAPLRNTIFGLLTSNTRFGARRTTYHFLRTLFSRQRIRQAQAAGALEHSGINHFFEMGGLPDKLVQVTRAPMSAAEVILRTSAAHCGLATWTRAIKKANKRYQKTGKLTVPPWLLRELTRRDVGFTAKQVQTMANRGKPDNVEARKLMRGAVRITQFTADAKDIPKSWGTETGRFVTQFWSMAYKHTQNTVGYALEEAGHGNLAPLGRFAVATMFAGIGWKVLEAVFAGRMPDKRDLDELDKWLDFIGESLGWVEKPLETFTSSRAEVWSRQAFAPWNTAASMAAAAVGAVKAFTGDDKEKQDKAAKRAIRQFGIGRDTLNIAEQYQRGQGIGQEKMDITSDPDKAGTYYRRTLANIYRRDIDEGSEGFLRRQGRNVIQRIRKQETEAPADRKKRLIKELNDWGRKNKVHINEETQKARQSLRGEFYDALYDAKQAGDTQQAKRLRRRLLVDLKAKNRDINKALKNRRLKKAQ